MILNLYDLVIFCRVLADAESCRTFDSDYNLKLFGVTYGHDMRPMNVYLGAAKGTLKEVLVNKHQEVSYKLVSLNLSHFRHNDIMSSVPELDWATGRCKYSAYGQ